MLSDDAARQIEQREQQRQARLRGDSPYSEHAGRFGPSTFGAIAEITPGMEIWSVDDGRRNWHNEPLGGIVLHVDPGRSWTDTDTGEKITQPARYRCYDPLAPWPHNAFAWLEEPIVNRQAIAVTPGVSLVHAIRRFCRQVATGPRTLSGFDAQLVTDAHHLVAVVMGGGTHT